MKVQQLLLLTQMNFSPYFPPNRIIISINKKYRLAIVFFQFLASLFHSQKVNKTPLNRNIQIDNTLTPKLKSPYHNKFKSIAIPIIAMTNSFI